VLQTALEAAEQLGWSEIAKRVRSLLNQPAEANGQRLEKDNTRAE
jgi:hypothetical protein